MDAMVIVAWIRDKRGSSTDISKDFDSKILVSGETQEFPGCESWGVCVTLRDVLNAMIAEPRYRKFKESGNPQIYLEWFDTVGYGNVWEAYFTS